MYQFEIKTLGKRNHANIFFLHYYREQNYTIFTCSTTSCNNSSNLDIL